jgi:2-polyprenyl-3-methyl-5-hydroxy-6-metoxy-1,4-benzoquinol methylase
MEMTTLQQTSLSRTGRRLRLLVAIASYGNKNIEFLKRIIRNYRTMDMEVAIFVLSEAPKDLGPDVNVLVGLPSRNPWSLPFAHKKVFAENLECYDLFVYSEDDVEVTEENIHSFLRVTPLLDPDEIAGFLRYETDASGNVSFPEAHGPFHWNAETVNQRGPYTVAEFTNFHAGFYILTQTQLSRAIRSGGFLRKPYEGRYGLPETAATDPYTCCGFRKVIFVSALNEFVLHHLPNRYVGQFGLAISSFTEQIQTLADIREGVHPRTSLCETESKILHGRWSKSYYEEVSDDLLELVPQDAKAILSIGCGWGATENELKRQGAKVTALPLDSVIGAVASRLGIEVIYGNLEECLEQLGGRKFQCVLITNLLHLLRDPLRLLDRCAELVDAGGTLLVSGVNFDYLPVLFRRTLRLGEYRKLRNFSESGINVLEVDAVIRKIERTGLRFTSLRRRSVGRPLDISTVRLRLGRWLTGSWIVQAQKPIPSSKHRFEAQNNFSQNS